MAENAGMFVKWTSAAVATATLVGVAGTALSAEITRGRLNEVQYRRIVADVFGPSIDIGGRFEPEVRRDGLMAVGAGFVSVTPSGMEEFDKIARNIAQQVVSEEHRASLIPCTPSAPNKADAKCAGTFLSEAGKLLFRRPLSNSEVKDYVKVASQSTDKLGDFYAGLGTALWTLMVSPEFLFQQEHLVADADNPALLELDAYSKASRLSFLLWNAAPSPELLAAAENGDLNTMEGVTRQVDKMLASPRLADGVRSFFADMLGFDEFDSLAKDSELFPKFSFQVANDAREQTLRTLADHLVVQKGDYRDIFTTRRTFLTPLLGSIYGVAVNPDAAWQVYEFPEGDPRSGILSQVSFTALHSHPGRTSPTLRGKALRELLMCQIVPQPPGAVDFTLVDETDNSQFKTARDRLDAHAAEPMCAGCHRITDPMGLALEKFDTSGQYRMTEHGATIDTSGALDGVNFDGAVGLGQTLQDHPAPTDCVVNRLLSFSVGRALTKADDPWVARLQSVFADSGYQFPALLREIVTSEEFYHVPAESMRTQAAPYVKMASDTSTQEIRK